MNTLILKTIPLLANLLLGSGVFARILGTVERWAQKALTGAEKRHGVLDELEVIGLKLTESAARLGIELAVAYLKRQG